MWWGCAFVEEIVMRLSVWLVTRKRKRGMTYAVRWVDPATGRMRCEGCGRDRHLAKRLVERKRAELRGGLMGDPIRAPFDEFVHMVLEKLAQKGWSSTAR